MVDRYGSFAELAAENTEGVEYRIRVTDRGSPVLILAPHGGTIEPETAEIAEAIAGDDLSFYAFEALQPGAFGDFHITSHKFDEPRALEIVEQSSLAVAIHGRRDDGTDKVWIGGRAREAGNAISAALEEAGYGAERNKRLPGLHETNICNRTKTGAGVQLELSRTMRRHLAAHPAALDAFAIAVRAGIAAVTPT
ncbi:poly-gamma-glutamate hydrolase family protein [Hasllibacter sp. MH4015]|uniref:poly-gamma-glutamate hydrolase family protein n=1 Tax=Hasllibacter sp. MH4015 TaxID=2854029 RepID=UPI001CD5A6AA|nr:poly-gamma-glutamate hydrolase family protein [Hasllibacter sp. MH4015]